MRTYHTCGYPIWVEIHTDELIHARVYSDDDEESDTYGEEVTRCPGCDGWLSDESLRAESQE